MLKLWGRPNSSNVKKVLWTLEELGVAYENIVIGGNFSDLNTSQYLSLNPNAKIPTLQDGEFILWESNSIVRYLAATYNKNILWINDPKKRAEAEKWMDWTLSSFYPPFPTIMQQKIRLPLGQRNSVTLQNAVNTFEKKLAILELALDKNEWLSGEQFGIADICVGVFIYYYYELKLSTGSYFPNVKNWYERLAKREPYQKIVITPIG